jgi:sugar O-acyltransferase (sialic acid O-acetyltransferase NeuD family)
MIMDVVIFGCAEHTSLAWYVLTHDSQHKVKGFTVNKSYCTEKTFHDLPLVPFEELERTFPPDEVALLIPLGARDMNGLRKARYLEAKERGYRFISYISTRASVWPDLKIGENCMIFDGAAVQPFAEIGNNCSIRSGALIAHHTVLKDHCFVAAHAVVAGGCSVGECSFLGLNSTIRDGIKIAPRCFIAAGAVVTRDTGENGLYMGVPAKRSKTPVHEIKAW